MADLNLEGYRNSNSLAGRFGRLVWGIVWLCLFRPTPRWCLSSWRIFLLKMFGARVCWNCRILPSVKVWAPWNLSIGAGSTLAEDVDIYNIAPIVIGRDVVVSQGAFLCSASHDISSPTMKLTFAPIEVKDKAWVTARAIVMPGRTVGEGAVVACAAVVVKDVRPWTVVGGNPAREIGSRTLI